MIPFHGATAGLQKQTWERDRLGLCSPPKTVGMLLRPSRKAAWYARCLRQMAQEQRFCQLSGQTCPRRLAPRRASAELILPRAPRLFLVLLSFVALSEPDHKQAVSWTHLHPPQAV